MSKRLYVVTRDLHLYAGLFLSPFVVVFAVSVFYLAHSQVAVESAAATRVATGVNFPESLDSLNGRELVDGLRPVLDRVGVSGEVNFVRKIPKDHRIVVPVMQPGREITVDLDMERHTATVADQTTGFAEALIHLHKMPGPHNVSVRGNSLYMRVWRVLADATTYGLLFLTLSGVYLWTVLRAERRVGLALISAGAFSFFGVLYAICR